MIDRYSWTVSHWSTSVMAMPAVHGRAQKASKAGLVMLGMYTVHSTLVCCRPPDLALSLALGVSPLDLTIGRMLSGVMNRANISSGLSKSDNLEDISRHLIPVNHW